MGMQARKFRNVFGVIGMLMACLLSAKAQTDMILVNFSGGSGVQPYGSLIADSAGNLYGTTFAGGAFSAGTIFVLTKSTGFSETVLYNFMGAKDGGFPMAGLLMDASGNLYGTASCGGGATVCTNGSGGFGVVFRLSATGYSVLYPFTGGADGANPVASLIFDNAMNLVGTTEAGGTGTCLGHAGCGVVFELSGNNYQTESVLYPFKGGLDGGVPRAPVTLGPAGFFGTTYAGGRGACLGTGSGCGVVFALSLSGTERVLHPFMAKGDGSLPIAPVIFDPASSTLYGAASAGGHTTPMCTIGCGTIFQLTGTSLTTFKPIHSFSGHDGATPTGGLAFDGTYLYGTTFAGGAPNLGVVFALQPQPTITFSPIHVFTGPPGDGANPFAGLLLTVDPIADDDALPPTKKSCPSKCAGVTVAGGTQNGGTGYVP